MEFLSRYRFMPVGCVHEDICLQPVDRANTEHRDKTQHFGAGSGDHRGL